MQINQYQWDSTLDTLQNTHARKAHFESELLRIQAEAMAQEYTLKYGTVNDRTFKPTGSGSESGTES